MATYVQILEAARNMMEREYLYNNEMGFICNCVDYATDANDKKKTHIKQFILDAVYPKCILSVWLRANCQEASDWINSVTDEEETREMNLYRIRYINEVLIPHFSQLDSQGN
jgi:hypothetical protein